MRGLRSRLAVSALALLLGVAGARSLGSSSPASAATHFPEATAAHASGALGSTALGLGPSSAGGGWKQAESERTSHGSGAGRPCPARPAASLHTPCASRPAPEPPELPAPRWRGLLGLRASPANAPPGS